MARKAGLLLSGLAVLFLTMDAAGKLLRLQPVLAATEQLGWPADSVPVIGVLAVICLALYVIPRTAVLGAILWTGYLGGAIATHLRIGSPLLSHTLFPAYIAALLWGGLYLRDRRVAAIIGKP